MKRRTASCSIAAAVALTGFLSGCITVNTSPEVTVTATVPATPSGVTSPPTLAPPTTPSPIAPSTGAAPTLSPPTPLPTEDDLTLAEAMASGSGYGFGEDRCYEAELADSDPTFGTLYLSDFGEQNRSDCQAIDAVVAIVHQSGDSWEMVDYFLSPDCVSARENLEGFGASEATILDIIGDWPCG